MKVNEQRIAANFIAMKNFSVHGEGITRLAFSDEDWQARAFIIKKMQEGKLQISIDEFGNIIGKRLGLNPQAPIVMCGSHIDSVPHGGNFDGVLGVLAAIEVVNMMNECDFLNYHTLAICVFMCEESSRFGVATLGSRAMCGQLPLTDMYQLKDASGKSLYHVLQERNLHPEKLRMNSEIKNHKVKACVEMHIEQGKVLEQLQKPIGIVTGIAAPTRIKLRLTGNADHSGATPMDMRKDTLCAAAEIILAVEKLAQNAIEPVVGTVGIINAQPNVMNVIPGYTELGIDIRSIYAEPKTAVVTAVREAIAVIAKKRDITYELTVLCDEQPVVLADSIIDEIEAICIANDVAYHKLPSGAGHDTMHLAEFAPAGMIFIPCRGGISHNPAEWAEQKDIVQGIEVLYQLLCRLTAQ